MPDMIIAELLTRLEQATSQYGGEAVNQRDHALQCAQLAADAGEGPAMIAACLLHDVGHLLHGLGDDCAEAGVDDAHEVRAARALAAWFPPAVVQPIALHVAAKQALCHLDHDYQGTLSPASITSLELQGGVFDAAACQTFLAKPFAQDAIRLRRYDDQAKDPEADTLPLSIFRHLLRDLTLSQTAADA